MKKEGEKIENIKPETEQIILKEGRSEPTGYKTCRHCGTEYNALFRSCPNCGYSFMREMLKGLSLLIIAAGLFTAIFITGNKVCALSTTVDEMKEDLIQTKNSVLTMSTAQNEPVENEAIDITGLSYYEEQKIVSGMDLAALEEDYLIYAHQDGCPACIEANEYIYAYLANGYPNYLPIFFITPDSAEEIFFDVLGCMETPTVYRMTKNEVVEKETGVEGVFNLLDRVVKKANGEENREVKE